MFKFKKLQIFVGVLAGFSLMGCVNTSTPTDLTSQASHVEQDSTANLFVYRPFTFQNGTYQPVVMVNGERVARLKAGGYMQVPLTEGDNVMALHHMKNAFQIVEEPFYQATISSSKGKNYFFRWGDHSEFGLGNVPVQSAYDYSFVSPTEGKEALSNKNLVALN